MEGKKALPPPQPKPPTRVFLKPPKKQDHSKARKEIQNEPPKIQKKKITTFFKTENPCIV